MNRCILVFGMPRSGTTWIGKLFDSHPDTLYRHELEQFVACLPEWRSPKVVGKQPLFPKNYQSIAALCAYRLSVTAAKAASRARKDFPCLYRPTAARSERARLVWKSIESSGRLGACVEALPQARAIHLMRHPCGYVASVLRGAASKRFEA